MEANDILPDGYKVKGVVDLKGYLLKNKSQEFARGLVVKLMTYGMGRSIDLSEQDIVDKLTAKFFAGNLKMKSVIKDFMMSEIFLTK